MQRRQFLKLGLAISTIAPWTAWSGAVEQRSLLLSATTDLLGQHFISGFSLSGEAQFTIPVANRAHHSLYLAKPNHAIFFSRRPGRQAHIVDLDAGELLHTIDSAKGRHFFGHGCVDASGRYLFVTENDYENAVGVIGVYDIGAAYQRVGEFSSHGVGPHQLAMLPDNETLVIGNGGIHTHPDHGRRKLNIAQMQSCLSYVESTSGKLVAEYLPPDPQISLRHLDVSRSGAVAVGAQYQGDAKRTVPLLFTHGGEESLQVAEAESRDWQRFKQYIASVRYLDSSQIAVTSPRGNVLAVWTNKHSRPDFVEIRDCAGLAFDRERGQCIVSDGQGALSFFSTEEMKVSRSKVVRVLNTRWDNHLELVSA